MDCKEFRELLDLYVDGELSPEATLSARAHLEGCAACSRVERQLIRLRGAVKRVVSEVEPPLELERKVRNLARPGWRKVTGPLLEPSRVNAGGGAAVSFWRKKIAVPVPAFALILFGALALGGWIISTLNMTPSPSNPASSRRAAPQPSGSGPSTAFDLTRFDRGERAAIYKVRSTDFTKQ